MTDTEKREKVILGLRCHKAGYYEECLSKCPYRDDGCETTLCNDAIALLKEQEKQLKEWEKNVPFLAAHGILKGDEDNA